jgi:hypothetical protein
MHIGAEGSEYAHVPPGAETYLGEPRGNSRAFSHAAVDAGADLVVGHGPHVLRGMESYRGRLIAHSLGNLSGYRTLNMAGVRAYSAILRVTLDAEGEFVDARLVPLLHCGSSVKGRRRVTRVVARSRSSGSSPRPTSAPLRSPSTLTVASLCVRPS